MIERGAGGRGGGEVTGWKQRETREDRHTNIQTNPVMTTTMIRMVTMTMELCSSKVTGTWLHFVFFSQPFSLPTA